MREQKGSKSALSKFTDKQAKNIRMEYASTTIKQGELAKRENVSRRTINLLLSGKTYEY